MNLEQIQSLCERIKFSLIYEDYDACNGERVLELLEEAKDKLFKLKISDQKV